VNPLDQWVVAELVLVRCAAFVTTMPVFRHGTIPRTVKVGLVLAFTLALSPTVSAPPDVGDWGWLEMVRAVLREAIVGGVLGFAFGLLIEPAKVAGEYLEDQMGLRLGQVVDPTSGTAATTLGQLLEGFTILLFFASGMHHVVIWGLQRSFLLVNLAASVDGASYQRVVTQATRIPELGMMLAFPLGMILFLVSVHSVVTIRAAPQFQYFTVGLTLRILVALIALPWLFPELMWMTSRLFHHVGSAAGQLFAVTGSRS
jgi:flagellar biosynthetic protein FliR